MDFNEMLVGITGEVSGFLYTYILLVLLVFVGVYFTIRTKGVQIRFIKDMFTQLTEKKHVKGERSISSFQALMVSTASRVGTGNIAGVATAIATGFNPSFYYADFISAQQRAYNLTPHFTYLAYFSPKHVKAGISSETRGIERLLEQGARAARIVGRFGCADDARELEAALCAQPGILETMRASKKVDLLVNERFDFVEAKAVLDDVVERLGLEGAEPAQDLSPHYFGGPSPDCHDLQVPEGHDGECGGRCIGMVGGALVFQQEGTNYVVSVKEWESHEVELLLDEVVCTYDFAPQQFSLF